MFFTDDIQRSQWKESSLNFTNQTQGFLDDACKVSMHIDFSRCFHASQLFAASLRFSVQTLGNLYVPYLPTYPEPHSTLPHKYQFEVTADPVLRPDHPGGTLLTSRRRLRQKSLVNTPRNISVHRTRVLLNPPSRVHIRPSSLRGMHNHDPILHPTRSRDRSALHRRSTLGCFGRATESLSRYRLRKGFLMGGMMAVCGWVQ
jgi:hypothetical protein